MSERRQAAVEPAPFEAAVYTIRQPLKLVEVAEILRCSEKTVRRLIGRGLLPAFRASEKRGELRVRPEWLEAFMDAGGRTQARARGPRPIDDVEQIEATAQPMPRRPGPRAALPGSGTLTVPSAAGRSAA